MQTSQQSKSVPQLRSLDPKPAPSKVRAEMLNGYQARVEKMRASLEQIAEYSCDPHVVELALEGLGHL